MADPLSPPGFDYAERRRTMLDTRYGQMHVRLGGHFSIQRPALILLHATPQSGAMYELLMPRLGADRLVVAPDRLGFGFSDFPPQPLEMPQIAEATLDAVEALQIDQFDIVGTQAGSVEALELAVEQVNRVRKVVMIGIPAFPESVVRGAAPEPPEDGDGPSLEWRRLQARLAGERQWWPDQAVHEYPTVERFQEFRQPLLVLAPHDELWAQTERLYRTGGLPSQAGFIELPHLSRDISYVAADEVEGLLRAFLDDASGAIPPWIG